MKARSIAVALIFLASATALAGSSVLIGPDPSPTYTLTLLNTWELTWASGFESLVELDYDASSGYLRCVCPGTDSLFVFQTSDPAVLVEVFDLPAFFELPRGVATKGSGSTHWTYVTEGNSEGSYFGYNNGAWMWWTGRPAGVYGMGLDLDTAGYLWEAERFGSVYRYYPGGLAQQFDLETTDADPKGLTVFPVESGTGVAVGYADNGLVEFYEFTSSSEWEYTGSADLPVSVDFLRGLEYVADSGTFYMLGNVGSDFFIYELGSDIGLEAETWGGIKASFE